MLQLLKQKTDKVYNSTVHRLENVSLITIWTVHLSVMIILAYIYV